MDQPFMPVVVFFLALGAIVGWLAHIVWCRDEVAKVERRWRARTGALEQERDRLREQVRAGRHAGALAETASAEASGARQREFRRVEEALAAAHHTIDEHKAEIERLEARLAARPPSPAPEEPGAGARPPSPRPGDQPDDLKRISGIGPAIEKTLHGLGIHHFDQIAALTPEHVAWIDREVGFRGRIERESWIEQAKALRDDG